MAATEGARPARAEAVVLGLLADPDLSTDVARRLAVELPALLSQRVSGRVSWEVRVGSDRFAAGEQGAVRMMEVARERMTVRLVEELVGERLGSSRAGQEPDRRARHRLAELAVPVRRVVPAGDDVDVRFVAPGLRGQARLLAAGPSRW